MRNISHEQNEIHKALREAKDDGLCETITISGDDVDEIFKVLQARKYKNRIRLFHFGGHADGAQLLFGKRKALHAENFAKFLSYQSGLEVVFLNGCATYDQAKEYLSAGIKYVIATNRQINDKAAGEFSTIFYRQLALGTDIYFLR